MFHCCLTLPIGIWLTKYFWSHKLVLWEYVYQEQISYMECCSSLLNLYELFYMQNVLSHFICIFFSVSVKGRWDKLLKGKSKILDHCQKNIYKNYFFKELNRKMYSHIFRYNSDAIVIDLKMFLIRIQYYYSKEI